MTVSSGQTGSKSWRRRAIAMGATLALHGAALFLALLPGQWEVSSPSETVATFDIVAPGPPKPTSPQQRQIEVVPPPPPVEPPIVLPPPALILPTDIPAVMALLKQADQQASGGGCDLTSPVEAALRLSPDVQNQLPSIPPEERSVANALAVWNEDWVAPETLQSEEVFATIRNTIALTIEAASEACRLQVQAGPRLLYLPREAARGETVVLSVGSGTWTWQQVAESAERQSREATEPVGGSEDPRSTSQTTKILEALFGP